MSEVIFLEGSGFRDSMLKHPEAYESVADFMTQKGRSPLAAYGNSDTTFSSSGYFSGFRHAHLTRDLALIYTLSGANPREFRMYGVYSHAELGTGTPPNHRKQKSAAQVIK